MGLVRCNDCGHEVSDRATACPKCGRPPFAPGESKASGLGGGLLLLLLLAGIGVAVAASQLGSRPAVGANKDGAAGLAQGTVNFDWGGQLTGLFDADGRPVRGSLALPDGTLIEGDFQAQSGRITYPDRRVYEGDWDGGPHERARRLGDWWVERPHGQGTMTWPDGRTQEGRWDEGTFVGAD